MFGLTTLHEQRPQLKTTASVAGKRSKAPNRRRFYIFRIIPADHDGKVIDKLLVFNLCLITMDLKYSESQFHRIFFPTRYSQIGKLGKTIFMYWTVYEKQFTFFMNWSSIFQTDFQSEYFAALTDMKTAYQYSSGFCQILHLYM